MLILEIEKSIKGPQKHDSVRPVTTTACVTPAGFFFFSFFFFFTNHRWLRPARQLENCKEQLCSLDYLITESEILAAAKRLK